eukprot:jgi/Chlat1/4112/Chrsp26S04123
MRTIQPDGWMLALAPHQLSARTTATARRAAEMVGQRRAASQPKVSQQSGAMNALQRKKQQRAQRFVDFI